ncbi:MAG: PqqD family protein [Myxococcales bacterium]|nr:PqqD family protein [Myxococcales bacterium]MCB9526735.1 PqqD family protein [Myxococcales bacterium]
MSSTQTHHTDPQTATLANLAVSPTGFVFDPRTGATFSVNPSGRALLEGIRDGLSLDALVDKLADDFEAAGADLRRDAMEFARSLKDQGLLPNTFELA